MQKVLRRTLLARNQALRRQRRVAEKALIEQRNDKLRQQSMLDRDIADEIRQERRGRREDFLLGPLAPKRDVGDRRLSYGTRPIHHSQEVEVEKIARVKYFNFAVGDRVCIVRGREKGKIGKVKSVDEESQTLRVDGVNRVDVALMEFQRVEDPSRGPFQTRELPISILDVRLVVPLKDPQTGAVKEVIIRDMYGGEPTIERHHFSKLPTHTRYVHGLDLEIPWPEEKISGQDTYSSDTPRLYVEHSTFIPTLVTQPLPSDLIDEIRNPYNKMRNDHERTFVEEKVIEDLKELHRARQQLVTPQTEFWQKHVQEKAWRRSSGVTEETMKLIAEVKASKQTR